ncbi:hypothetical protein [Leisingera sp. M523]|uniref:hypothetical protein n=1 Tax=Leisingera sp. M523 TaxID=2867013 RepID=UPI0021A4152F|nr:hypothetical protein [Leisingera sp. M523]UWQ30256.1 hypothetical protein K3557_06885 [Leisingera sp. M523]
MSKGHFATGTVEGTGSAINVELGFTPDYVRLINIDGDATLDWTSSMTNGEGYKTVAAGANAQVGTGGVTPYAGAEASAAAGFTIGTDADVNVSGETLMWVAWGKE